MLVMKGMNFGFYFLLKTHVLESTLAALLIILKEKQKARKLGQIFLTKQ